MDEDRENLLEHGYYNTFNQYNLSSLAEHMKFHADTIKKCRADKEKA